MKEIVKLLTEAGYKTTVGADEVRKMIMLVSDGDNEKRCSGYRVFPDGTKCYGCKDCE